MTYNRVLITGGAGLIGSHIADLLAADDVSEIIILDDLTRGCLDNLASAQARGNLRFIQGDIRDQALVRKLMEGVDVVFHQAAIRITHAAENPRLAIQTLIDGTFNVVESAQQAGVRKVVAASSASVYGLADFFPTPELHHGYHNHTLYGAAKLFNEGLLDSFHHTYGLNYIALRYFNVYGPRMDTCGAYTEVLIRWMENLSQGKPCLILGDGNQTMDFVYVEDIARANILAAKSDLTHGVFNVASGVETSLKELAALLSRIMESDSAPVHGPARKVNSVTRRLADTSRAEHELHFRANISLEQGLRQLVSWWHQQQAPALAASQQSMQVTVPA